MKLLLIGHTERYPVAETPQVYQQIMKFISGL